MVLDRALVQRRVGPADVELGAGLGELHPENGALDVPLRLRLVDERRVAEARDLRVGHPEDAVDRVAGEAARERGHRGEVLRRRRDACDGHCGVLSVGVMVCREIRHTGVGVDGPRYGRAVGVADVESTGLGRRRARRRDVELVLRAARRTRAVRRRDPEVSGTGCKRYPVRHCALSVPVLLTVEVDEEVLSWCADRNISGPLQVTLLINSWFLLPLLVVGHASIVRAGSLDFGSLKQAQSVH